MSSAPTLIQGRDYDAKIAFYDTPFVRLDNRPGSDFNVLKHHRFTLNPGDITASVYVWSKTADPFWDGEIKKWSGGEIPDELPLNSLLRGREGDIIKIQIGCLDYRLLCAQKDAIHYGVDPTINFQDWIFKQKRQKIFGGTIPFNAQQYLAEFLETNVPKITGTKHEDYDKFPWVATEKADQVYRRFVSERKDMATVCDLLRSRLIEKQEPDLWYNLYLYSKNHPKKDPIQRQLYDVCIALAKYRPDITQKYSEANSTQALQQLSSPAEIKAKSEEAKTLNRNEVVRNLRAILNLEL